MDLSKLPRLSQTSAPGGDPASPSSASAEKESASDAPSAGATDSAGVPLFCRCGAQLSPGVRFCSHCGASFADATGDAGANPPVGLGAEAWISLVMGVLLLYLCPNIPQWLFSKVSPSYKPPFLPITDVVRDSGTGLPVTEPQTGLLKRVEVPYTSSIYFPEHLSVFAFAAVLLVDGLVLLMVRRRAVVWAALGLTVASLLLAAWAVMDGFRTNRGLLLYPVICLAFGVYLAIYQAALARGLRGRG